MDQILNFIKDNLLLIIYIVLFLIEILVILLKRPVKTDSLKEKILNFLPFAINLAEQIIPSGSADKLRFALDTVKEHFDIKSVKYDEFIVSSVESILTTPKKK